MNKPKLFGKIGSCGYIYKVGYLGYIYKVGYLGIKIRGADWELWLYL